MKGGKKGKKKEKWLEEKEEKAWEPVLAPLIIFHDLGEVTYPLSNSRILICEGGRG